MEDWDSEKIKLKMTSTLDMEAKINSKLVEVLDSEVELMAVALIQMLLEVAIKIHRLMSLRLLFLEQGMQREWLEEAAQLLSDKLHHNKDLIQVDYLQVVMTLELLEGEM